MTAVTPLLSTFRSSFFRSVSIAMRALKSVMQFTSLLRARRTFRVMFVVLQVEGIRRYFEFVRSNIVCRYVFLNRRCRCKGPP